MSKSIDKAKIQSSEIIAQAFDYVAEKFQQEGKVFTLASAYGQILSVISKLSEMNFYYMEDSLTEGNILTASRTQSIQGLARLTGHNATRAIAATGELKMKVSSRPTMQGTYIVIPNFSQLKCVNNGKVYTINLTQEELRIDTRSTTEFYANVVQGEIQTQIFTGNNTPLQSYVALTKGSVLVDHFFVKIYVNGEKWKAYDSIYDMPRNAKGYLVKTGISGGIDIYFGNTNFGKAPGLGSEIRIEYLLTGGEGGNIREDEDIQFNWIDTGYSVVGETVDLNKSLSTGINKLISFGTNPEPTFLTRLIAPKTSRSYVLANPDNYIIFIEKFNYFSVVDAFSTFDDDYLDDDNVVYLFLIPDITKRLQNDENYFTVPKTYFSLTEQEKNKVIDLIEDSGSKIVTTVVKIIDPFIKRYVVNISLVVFEGYSLDLIKATIISRLSDYFLSLRRRDMVPQSDIVSMIENISGVDSVNVSFLSEANELSKTTDSEADVLGLDELGDITIGRDELPLVRGGWTDRNGIYYEDGIFDDKPGSVNINVKKVSKKDLNSRLFDETMTKIRS